MFVSDKYYIHLTQKYTTLDLQCVALFLHLHFTAKKKQKIVIVMCDGGCLLKVCNHWSCQLDIIMVFVEHQSTQIFVVAENREIPIGYGILKQTNKLIRQKVLVQLFLCWPS